MIDNFFNQKNLISAEIHILNNTTLSINSFLVTKPVTDIKELGFNLNTFKQFLKEKVSFAETIFNPTSYIKLVPVFSETKKIENIEIVDKLKEEKNEEVKTVVSNEGLVEEIIETVEEITTDVIQESSVDKVEEESTTKAKSTSNNKKKKGK
jgi:undecaprenyl pyrophosphate synthase